MSASINDGVCVHIEVPKQVCYLRFAAGVPERTEYVGQSSRGEMVIFDYDAAGRILGIELVGDDKPCQRNVGAD
jgi:uncharacterized protein DUF2283